MDQNWCRDRNTFGQ